jgi:hypothetical protein
MSRRDRSALPTTGYSQTPLARKLGIGPGTRLALIDAPASLPAALGELPPGATLHRRLGGRFDVIVAAFIERARLERRLPALIRAVRLDGGLWLAWPKRTSGVATDLSDIVVRELGLAAGLVDNKVCAIDDILSALRFVYRIEDRR